MAPESEISRIVENAPEGSFVKTYPAIKIDYLQPALPQMLTYIGYCCREWPMAYGFSPGRCGFCGERPTFLREDD